MVLLLRRRRELICRDAVALMAAYLDGELLKRDRNALQRHLAACPLCSEHLAQLRATISVLGQVGPDDVHAQALDDLVNVYRRWKSEPRSSTDD